MCAVQSAVVSSGTRFGGMYCLHLHGRTGISSVCACLCGLVVRVLGYRSGALGSIPGTSRIKVVDLERGPLGLVSTTEELLDRKVTAPV
jgi:hypothetical protein